MWRSKAKHHLNSQRHLTVEGRTDDAPFFKLWFLFVVHGWRCLFSLFANERWEVGALVTVHENVKFRLFAFLFFFLISIQTKKKAGQCL